MGYEEQALHNVRRKIAEVVKKEGEKIVVGYTGKTVKREEGDVWEDADGKTWTVLNGVTQSISKLQSARTPLFCPVCEKTMGHWLDTKFWRLRGKCQDCVLKEEAELRLTGKWEQYQLVGELKNQISFLEDKINELISYRDSLSEPEIIHADDEKILMIEKWTVDLNKVRSDINADIEEFQRVLKNTRDHLIEVQNDGN